MERTPSIILPHDRPFRVVMVCLGNICRSPMAKTVFRSDLEAADLNGVVEVDSAGTGSWHVGQSADRRAASILRRHGYDATHTARQLTRSDLADFDLILVADHANRSDVIDLARTPGEAAKIAMIRSFDPTAPGDAEIPDPYYGEGDGFERVLGMIERSSAGFVEATRGAVTERA